MSVFGQVTASRQTALLGFYAAWVFGFLLLIVGVNFYQVLIVAPDYVGLDAFNRALLSSAGFWQDLLHFVLGLLVVHVCWLLLLWVGTGGWLVTLKLSVKEIRLLQFLLFLTTLFFFLIWSNRAYPNMPLSGFLKHSVFLKSDAVFWVFCSVFLISAALSVLYFARQNIKPFLMLVSLGVVSSFIWFGGKSVDAKAQSSSEPNIFIIGIDSLRPDQTGYFGSKGELTPNIDKFLQQSAVYQTAYTPYARTFPAWMSILSGQEPVNHKGRFNLINHSRIDKEANVAKWLQDSGYRTVYAFDERRFNNIDESFGFDTVVGPEHGAMGFVLGGFDHPIINLLCNTEAGRWLFPMMHLNRGRDANYDPERYSQAIVEAVQKSEKPVFLAAHFLLPHWPWMSRNWEWLDNYEYPEAAGQSLYKYRMMLKQVDQQFGQFIADLEKTGALDNAYVFFVSDHGDGFEMPEDDVIPAIPDEDRIYDIFTNTRGHATNALNTGQYRVVLAARAYGRDQFEPELKGGNASLIDIAPTISHLLGNKFINKAFDGVSLIDATPSELDARALYLETGFVVVEITQEEINEKKVLAQTIGAYTVDDKGKLVIRDDFENLIMKGKHRAVIKGDWQLTMIPSLGPRLVLYNLKQKKWWPISQFDGDLDWPAMLSEMCEHYKADQSFDPHGVCGMSRVEIVSVDEVDQAARVDEQQFNNIDQSYGFDEVVGPKYGAFDFMRPQNNVVF